MTCRCRPDLCGSRAQDDFDFVWGRLLEPTLLTATRNLSYGPVTFSSPRPAGAPGNLRASLGHDLPFATEQWPVQRKVKFQKRRMLFFSFLQTPGGLVGRVCCVQRSCLALVCCLQMLSECVSSDPGSGMFARHVGSNLSMQRHVHLAQLLHISTHASTPHKPVKFDFRLHQKM